MRADDLDSFMYRDPPVPVARVVVTYPKGLIELWSAALERPERDVRARAALAIAQAHESGMPGLATTVPALIRALERTDEHTAVLAAVARALVVLDARDAAPAFRKLAESGDAELGALVEPTLARWDYKPAREVWLSRIDRGAPFGSSFLIAVDCLGLVREERALPRLRTLVHSAEVAPPVRLSSARVMGEIRTSGLEADAAKLAGDATSRGMISRLAAALLLRRHVGSEVIKLLQGLAGDPEPAVAFPAVERLGEIDSRHVLPVLKAVMASEGAEIRALGVKAMTRNPSDESVALLARVLSDPHPDVRERARKGLRVLASERKTLVIDRVSPVLNSSDWRGQEQSAILLAQLDHKPAAPRLVELLSVQRPEAAVAAAWGLRRLAVPETLPAILDHVKRRHAEMIRSGPTAGLRAFTPEALDQQLAQLTQFFGQAKYLPADVELRALVPRFLKPGMPPSFTPVRPETRAAAIWALGHLHEGKPNGELVTLIETRLTGDGAMGRDDPRVRRMAALALARLHAQQSLTALREHAEGEKPTVDVVANACRVAIALLSREPVNPAGTVENLQREWFLVPIK